MLNFSSGSGNGGSYIRFMAQKKEWENSSKESITLPPLVMDMNSVRTGWLLLGVGQRDWKEDEVVGKKSAQPTPDHKYGFSVKLYSKPTGVVEWCAAGIGATKGFESIFNLCDSQAEANFGKVPVIVYEGATSIKIGAGMTAIPNFKLKNWITRPAGLDVEAPAPAPAPKVVPKPVAKPAPAPMVDADEEMF